MNWVLAVVVAAVLAVTDEPSRDEVDLLIEKAISGPTVVRPQAARRLVNLGDIAADRLLARCGDGPRDLGRLGSAVVEVLGQFQDERLRKRLWQALADPDFPWRPAAARSLATTARPEEKTPWRKQLADPLAAVRVAALQGIERLDLRSAQGDVLRLLEDPDDRVRRRAAVLADRFGYPAALLLLVEDLRRDDHFFQNPTGRKARYESARILKELLGEDAGYVPAHAPTTESNAAAITRLEELVREHAGGASMELPAVARASGPTPGNVLGLELRSCRRGEFFLRWNEDDGLLVGTGKPARVQLPPGTTRRLQDLAKATAETLDRRTWGEAGCDLERFHLAQPDGRVQPFQISKGPDAVEGLRPEGLTALARAMLETLPEGGEDARLEDLRARVREALAVLGGAVEGP